MAVETPVRLTPGDHVVRFYESDADLAAVVAGYLAPVLAAGDNAIVIATPEHLALFDESLESVGCDVASARSGRRFTALDAAETLGLFMVADHPNPAKFEDVVGGLVTMSLRGGGAVHAYGEMVALLWEQGNVTAAIELEGLWNDLGQWLPFGLLCAYPTHLVATGDGEALARVCHAHTDVVRQPSGDPQQCSRAFVSGSLAPREARAFVRTTLQLWGLGAIAERAELVTGELTTNAVLHARSAFELVVTDHGESVRIAVSDRSADQPILRPPDASRPSGRGIAMVSVLANAWGSEATADGKTVWVDLADLP